MSRSAKPLACHTDDDETLSTVSELSLDPDEPRVNERGHDLYLLATKQARKERQQVKTRLHRKQPASTTMKKKKKPCLTIDEIDRLFEEKRLRPNAMHADLLDLYEKSTERIRSMLDTRQIDRFIQLTQARWNENSA